jgi:hypothetical protein
MGKDGKVGCCHGDAIVHSPLSSPEFGGGIAYPPSWIAGEAMFGLCNTPSLPPPLLYPIRDRR